LTVLVTGAAGFIGAHVARALTRRGDRVVGIDNLNAYYAPALKHARLDSLAGEAADAFRFIKADFADDAAFDALVADLPFDRIVHLGAQAGVRYSLEKPRACASANVAGQLNLLEAARNRGVRHMVYASSSSVYGNSAQLPLRVEQRVDQPISLYAATKKADD
jgi:UDP-glucuronate 4-epimerase